MYSPLQSNYKVNSRVIHDWVSNMQCFPPPMSPHPPFASHSSACCLYEKHFLKNVWFFCTLVDSTIADKVSRTTLCLVLAALLPSWLYTSLTIVVTPPCLLIPLPQVHASCWWSVLKFYIGVHCLWVFMITSLCFLIACPWKRQFCVGLSPSDFTLQTHPCSSRLYDFSYEPLNHFNKANKNNKIKPIKTTQNLGENYWEDKRPLNSLDLDTYPSESPLPSLLTYIRVWHFLFGSEQIIRPALWVKDHLW